MNNQQSVISRLLVDDDISVCVGWVLSEKPELSCDVFHESDGF